LNQSLHVGLCVFIIAAVIVGGFADDTPAIDDDTPVFKISTKRPEDRVVMKSEADQVVITITSPSGISHATIQRVDRRWPAKVQIQLRLQGLERFKLTAEPTKLEAAVSSRDGMVRLWKEGHEELPLDSKSPMWMEIRMINKEGGLAAKIPLKDGFFEMRLPEAMLESNPEKFKLEWIDFYRN
jgi:hypothetical protein